MALVGLGIEFVKPLCPDTEINKSWSKLYIIAKKNYAAAKWHTA